MVLTPAQARAFYDRFGRKQDTQAFYEDAALTELITHAGFEQASAVFELGCGTGRFALRLLQHHLPASTSYLGIDISKTMIDIATERLANYAGRARIEQSGDSMVFPLADHSVDRVVSTYVLDLLSENDIELALHEAQRILTPQGKLCLVSLTCGRGMIPRLVTGLWKTLFRLSASLVGGCRPLSLQPMLDPQHWVIEYHQVITQFGVPSEILIAHPAGNASQRR